MSDNKPNGKLSIKRHQMLTDMSKQMSGLELTKEFTIFGKKFVLSTLTFEEEQWVDTYATFNSGRLGLAFVALRPVAAISASIKSIDGVSVKDLFEFPTDITEELKSYTENPYNMRCWYMEQMAAWLSGDGSGGNTIQLVRELVSAYVQVADMRDKSWGELKNSSAMMPGGVSKVTSSPEKVSSQVTQM